MSSSDWSSDVCSSDLQGDAAKYLISAATGGKFADGRGTFSIGGAYSQSNPLIYTDRFDWRDWPTYRANPENTGIDDGIPDRVYSPHTRQLYYDYVPTYWLGGKRYMVEGGNVRESKRSEEHTSELQSLMRISYAAFC